MNRQRLWQTPDRQHATAIVTKTFYWFIDEWVLGKAGSLPFLDMRTIQIRREMPKGKLTFK